MEAIDWNHAIEPTPPATVRLGETELGTDHEVTFMEVRGVEGEDDALLIAATITSPTIEGNTLWLRGKYGAQNGLMSLLKAVDMDGDSIQGKTFTYTRVESEKSPSGYAHRWQLTPTDE